MPFSETINYIKTQFPHQDFIPLHAPVFRGNEKKYLLDTIESTFVSSVGAYVDKFEKDFAKFINVPNATAVVNGTSALQVALRLVGVTPEDEVITQALTFVATANAIAYNHATPVFIDVDIDTMGMSSKALRLFLEEFGDVRKDGCYNKSTGKRIAACMPMHTFGFMCRIDEIIEVCNNWSIPVVEDAAEAMGSYYKGKSASSFGDIAAFSFNGNKIITAGGGGAIVSNGIELATKAKYLTTTAKVSHKWNYFHDEIGYNFRMPNINAALLCAQLEQFEKIKISKKRLYEGYKEHFENRGIKFKTIPENTDWNYWLMSVELDNKQNRDAFLEATNTNGVMTRPIWQLMYKLPMYEHCQKDEQINAAYLEERIVNIPSSARRE